MKVSKYIAVFSLLNALAFCLTHSPAHAGQENKGSQPGGQAKSHMSNKGSANTNAQWSADPERGWVRVDERHQEHEESQTKEKPKQNHGKQKANGAKEKRNNN
jgi:hypothetical protein